jgi:cytochrome c peroxidase
VSNATAEGMRRPAPPARKPTNRRAAAAIVLTGIVLSAGFGLWAIVGTLRDVSARRIAVGKTNEWTRPVNVEVPLGLTAVPARADNPLTTGKVELGKLLFFDKRLSADDSVSCASCHDPERGWGDGTAVATGLRGQRGGRNTPSVVNAVHYAAMFWDGRAADLEEQALGPVLNPIEMGMPSKEALARKIAGIEGYRRLFDATFEDGVTPTNIARSIAAFERTLLAGDTPMDRLAAGDQTALGEAARRGKVLFFGKGNCSVCHTGANYTDDDYHNLGIGRSATGFSDAGRESVTGSVDDRGAFRTPSLRDVARTAPYMHDGRYNTLDEVIAFYDAGGIKSGALDPSMKPLGLTPREKADLVAFLHEGLTSRTYPVVPRPQLPR